MEKIIVSVTAVTENAPDGQKICAARVAYSCPLHLSVSADAFQVTGRRITGASVQGSTVTLALDLRDEGAPVIPPPPKPPKGAGKPHPSGEKMGGPPKNMPPAVRRPIQVEVRQVADIFGADGSVIPPDGKTYQSTRACEPVVEDFQQFSLDGMAYNLFVPKEPEPGKRYPLVLFIHDAGPCGPDPKLTLSQGYGAVGFAEEHWQKEHPCFVLAPQIDGGQPMTNDEFQVTGDFERVEKILAYVLAHYPVDPKRVYTTGQSMGCMASCELNIRHPELFAASLLVAGQWSPERMAACCPQNRMWILVSEHDQKAFPGMNAVTDAMERAGAAVARYRWDGSMPAGQLTAKAIQAMADDANIRYTVFEGSTVVPPEEDDNPGANHVHTWPVAYQIDGLKQWLFSNSR